MTILLIRNLHCPSCVSHVKNILFRLDPKPISVSSSIVSQTVTVRHETSISAHDISRALEEAGFDIECVTQAPKGDYSPIDDDSANSDHKADEHALQLVMKGWKPFKTPYYATKGRLDKHIERCEMCQAEKAKGIIPTPSPLPVSSCLGRPPLEKDEGDGAYQSLKHITAKTSNESFVEVVPTPSISNLVRASLSIAGMTCSSCVGKITKALQNLPWVRSVDVNLLTGSATVTFYDKERIANVVDTIKETGYEATVEECGDTQYDKIQAPLRTLDIWRASYAIGGMTCSSCVSAITKALEKFEWVKKVVVNLMSNSASVIFEGKTHVEQIAQAIEEIGYDATLSDIGAVKPFDRDESQRTVTIRVDGMYCDHCPARILDSLQSYRDRLQVVKPLTTANPMLQVTYTPWTPSFTIRHILSAISNVDIAFEPSIYHPPSLEERAQRMRARQRRRLLLRLILSISVGIPTFIIGIVFASLVPSSNAGRQYLMHPMWSGRASRSEWALLIMATPVYFFAADLFHRRAILEVRVLWRRGSKTPILQRFYRFGSMDMLMSLGISIAYFSSIAVLTIDATRSSRGSMQGNSTYFDSVVFLTMFLLIGRILEAYSKAKAGDAVTMLGKLRPTEALLVSQADNDAKLEDYHSEQGLHPIQIDLLEVGDVVLVPHGGSPPSDGLIIKGKSKFDESSLTGESRLVGKSMGDDVFAGTINRGGPVTVKVSNISGASMLDQIVAAVREGQTRRAPIERLADVLTSYFVPIVILIAVSDWIIWLALGTSRTLPADYLDVNVGGWAFWSLKFAIAVFVIACPCGIGLAAPTALFVGGGLAAKHGILVKGGGEAFQEASGLDCIVFDKTGTLTQGGEPAITDYEYLPGEDSRTILGLAMRLEESSSHPIAKAVVTFSHALDIQDVQPSKVEELAGKGMKGWFMLGGRHDQLTEAIIGNEALMLDHHVDIPTPIAATLGRWKAQGKSIVLIAIRHRIAESTQMADAGWKLSAIMAASDPLRPEAPDIIKALQARGIDTWMISGDNPITASAVGAMVGIPATNIIAGVLPEQKAEKIKYLQKSLQKPHKSTILGKSHRTSRRAIVAMVGDGINDSPALTVADVGIAIGSGSDIAISSAEFVLVSTGLTSLLTLIDLSRVVFTRIKFNFAWALIYNLIALPIAAGVLYPIKRNGTHVRLDPVWASLAMALSSVSVVSSSLLMRTQLPVFGFRSLKKN